MGLRRDDRLPDRDQGRQAVKNGTAGTTLTYQRGMGGRIADLTGKRSPEGRTWAFTYTPEGDLASVTDPAGTATSTAGDYTTSYTYDAWGQLLTAKDANGNVTTNSSFDPNGYPRQIADALAQTTTFVYDDAGRVLTRSPTRSARRATQTYDVVRPPAGLEGAQGPGRRGVRHHAGADVRSERQRHGQHRAERGAVHRGLRRRRPV